MVNKVLKNTKNSYGLISRLLHWIIAFFIIGQISVGFYMTSLSVAPEKYKLYGNHKAFGVCILIIVTIRLIWKLLNKAVLPPAGLPKIIVLTAKAAHLLLYFCMFVMPISGVMMSRFSGFAVNVFNLFTIPALSKNTEFAGLFYKLHAITAWCFVVLIIAHILAALYHHFIRKDEVLKRIITQIH